MDQEQASLFRLHMSPGVGRTTLFKLKNTFGTFTAALTAPPEDLVRMAQLSQRQANSILARDSPSLIQGFTALDQCSASLISFWDERYPESLK